MPSHQPETGTDSSEHHFSKLTLGVNRTSKTEPQPQLFTQLSERQQLESRVLWEGRSRDSKNHLLVIWNMVRHKAFAVFDRGNVGLELIPIPPSHRKAKGRANTVRHQLPQEAVESIDDRYAAASQSVNSAGTDTLASPEERTAPSFRSEASHPGNGKIPTKPFKQDSRRGSKKTSSINGIHRRRRRDIQW